VTLRYLRCVEQCDPEPSVAVAERPACFDDPRGWPYTVPGLMALPEHARQAVIDAPPLSPGDPDAPMFRGWLWGDPCPAAVPMRPAA